MPRPRPRPPESETLLSQALQVTVRHSSLRSTGPSENPRDKCHQTKNSNCPGWRLKVSVQSQAGKKTKVKYWGLLRVFFLLMCDMVCKHDFRTNLQPLLPTTLLSLHKKSSPSGFPAPIPASFLSFLKLFHSLGTGTPTRQI